MDTAKGTLQISKAGGALANVVAGSTVVTADDELVWTPANIDFYSRTAFTIKANDGELNSPVVSVKIDVGEITDVKALLGSGQTFYNVYDFDEYNLEMGTFTLKGTSGTWKDYVFDVTSFESDGTGNVTISNVTANGFSVSEGSYFKANVVLSDAHAVTALYGNPVNGLNQVTATFMVTGAPTVAQSTDWENADWMKDPETNQLFTSLTSLRDVLINTEYMNTVWINDDVDVKLIGNAGATSGTLVQILWDENWIYTEEPIVGTWSLSGGYLTVTTPVGITAFKMSSGNLMQTEIEPVGYTYQETWYYGSGWTLTSFQNTLIDSWNLDDTYLGDDALPNVLITTANFHDITMSDIPTLDTGKAYTNDYVSVTFTNETSGTITEDNGLIHNFTISGGVFTFEVDNVQQQYKLISADANQNVLILGNITNDLASSMNDEGTPGVITLLNKTALTPIDLTSVTIPTTLYETNTDAFGDDNRAVSYNLSQSSLGINNIYNGIPGTIESPWAYNISFSNQYTMNFSYSLWNNLYVIDGSMQLLSITNDGYYIFERDSVITTSMASNYDNTMLVDSSVSAYLASHDNHLGDLDWTLEGNEVNGYHYVNRDVSGNIIESVDAEYDIDGNLYIHWSSNEVEKVYWANNHIDYAGLMHTITYTNETVTLSDHQMYDYTFLIEGTRTGGNSDNIPTQSSAGVVSVDATVIDSFSIDAMKIQDVDAFNIGTYSNDNVSYLFTSSSGGEYSIFDSKVADVSVFNGQISYTPLDTMDHLSADVLMMTNDFMVIGYTASNPFDGSSMYSIETLVNEAIVSTSTPWPSTGTLTVYSPTANQMTNVYGHQVTINFDTTEINLTDLNGSVETYNFVIEGNAIVYTDQHFMSGMIDIAEVRMEYMASYNGMHIVKQTITPSGAPESLVIYNSYSDTNIFSTLVTHPLISHYDTLNDDSIIGTTSSDKFYVSDGNDLIDAGIDMKEDIFSYQVDSNQGNDTIYNFDASLDKIQLSTSQTEIDTNFAMYVTGIEAINGTDTLVTLSGGTTITLVGVLSTDVTSADFLGY